MENINMTDINKTDEEIILECVKKIESDNVTIHNQKVSFLKSTVGFVFFTFLTTMLLFGYSCTVYLEATRAMAIGADYETPKMTFIITGIFSGLVATGFLCNASTSLEHIKK
jgi:uncharacterized membrane protein (DUF106 family)